MGGGVTYFVRGFSGRGASSRSFDVDGPAPTCWAVVRDPSLLFEVWVSLAGVVPLFAGVGGFLWVEVRLLELRLSFAAPIINE